MERFSEYKYMCWFIFLLLLNPQNDSYSQTIALWLFDEQCGLYPSMVIEDASDNNYPLVIGLGGQIVKGKYGNALEPIDQPAIEIPDGDVRFGLKPVGKSTDRSIEPMNWWNANFCAMMTSGENHLRKEVGFVNASDSKLNLGEFDWTIEFWFNSNKRTGEEGIIFEVGQGPRGENQYTTRLSVNESLTAFKFLNFPTNSEYIITSNTTALNPAIDEWHHFAFAYNAEKKLMKHFVDGVPTAELNNFRFQSLDIGDEAYMSLGRDGLWQRPLQGKIDELRISNGVMYTQAFKSPKSFSPIKDGKFLKLELQKGPPLLFSEGDKQESPIPLLDRKHLFIDDALITKKEHIQFVVNPPKRAERVIDNIEGPFRKHLTVIEDDDGLIRIYNSIYDDYLAVRTSQDGINFTKPNMGREYRGQNNIVIHEMVGGLGNPFIDPNGSSETRWKYISGYHRRGIYVYTSPDGWIWTRIKRALLPFRSGTQSCTYYDDQRQMYVSYHRTGIFKTPGGVTERASVVTETKDLFHPIEYKPLSQQDYFDAAKKYRLREPLPWYLDNGPLTPGGFGLEFPNKFCPIDADPVGTDIYITKAQKYLWAPDTYIAFPIVYFHYEADGPITRQLLMDPIRGRGSGPVETQLSISRDGLNWQRHARPTYVGIGMHEGNNNYTAYIAHGMVRRGHEIWQYYFGETQYHSAWKKDESGRGVYRLIQRLDGFVSADSPYDKIATMITKPILFKGNRLVLNIDTDAAGYAQVGFLDETGKPIKGFSVDECLYINGDFIETEVEWFKNPEVIAKIKELNMEKDVSLFKQFKTSADVSDLEGRVVQLVFKMRGSKLYAMQFVER